jgi:hypothetical protein
MSGKPRPTSSERTPKQGTQGGFTNVLCYFEIEEWSEEHSRQAAELQAKLGIFKGSLRKVDAYEYPTE